MKELKPDDNSYLMAIGELFGFTSKNIKHATKTIDERETVEGAILLLSIGSKAGLIQYYSTENLENGVQFSVTLTDDAANILWQNQSYAPQA